MRVLVCGGRNYGYSACLHSLHTPSHCAAKQRDADEAAFLMTTLSDLPRPSCIIQGGAGGADKLARRWARDAGIKCLTFKADWYPNGFGRLDRGAGPRRNQRMIDEGRPDLVLAFPGGAGTADMVRRAKAAGIEVREVCRA